MKYQVPQFIEVESKIFGPLTLKQFIYLAGGAGIAFLLYVFLPFWLVVPLAAPFVGLALALAFYKYNNQPFVKVLENAIKHYFSGRLYVWKKLPSQHFSQEAIKTGPASAPPIYAPKLTQSRLKELAWSLDIKEGKNEEEKE
jgi:hypothetical protein